MLGLDGWPLATTLICTVASLCVVAVVITIAVTAPRTRRTEPATPARATGEDIRK